MEQRIMKQRLETKLVVIIGLIVLLLVPIFMIQNLIEERSELQKQVQLDIAKSSSGEQQVIGPFIQIQFIEDNITENIVETPKEMEALGQIKTLLLLPDSLKVKSELTSYEKYRGIYKALLYRSSNQLQGQFDIRNLKTLANKEVTGMYISLAISDIRGIGQGSRIRVNDKSYPLVPGTQLAQLPEGIHIELDFNTLLENDSLDYKVDLNLQGMRKLAIAPVGKDTNIDMQADWPHPSFVGDYLPVESTISEQGFTANWQTNYFATNLNQLFQYCIFQKQCEQFKQRSMGVNLIDGVDQYLKSYRASNYALLVLILVFASFFLLEVLRSEPIHPVQYGFVGLALAVFYLLLISLSEHLGFNLAYLLSALASSLLLGIYVAGMLKNTKHGSLFLLGILFLYSLLYGLLSAEDYALLMGSLLVFVVLSLIMVLTRTVNWYNSKNDEVN